VRLPDCVHEPVVEGHYARRELYRSAEHGYSMVAMTWGPGQGTHAARPLMGCGASKACGRDELEITQYESGSRSSRARDAFRCVEIGNLIAGTGSAPAA
jgi:hypothetical protein